MAGAESIEFSFDPATGVRTATYCGVVDDAGLYEAYRDLIVRPDFRPLAHDLADLRGLEALDVTPDGLRQLGLLLSGGGTLPRPEVVSGLAIVADTPLAFGLARMYQLMTESYLPKQTRVFTGLDEARAWLGALPRLE